MQPVKQILDWFAGFFSFFPSVELQQWPRVTAEQTGRLLDGTANSLRTRKVRPIRKSKPPQIFSPDEVLSHHKKRKNKQRKQPAKPAPPPSVFKPRTLKTERPLERKRKAKKRSLTTSKRDSSPIRKKEKPKKSSVTGENEERTIPEAVAQEVQTDLSIKEPEENTPAPHEKEVQENVQKDSTNWFVHQEETVTLEHALTLLRSDMCRHTLCTACETEENAPDKAVLLRLRKVFMELFPLCVANTETKDEHTVPAIWYSSSAPFWSSFKVFQDGLPMDVHIEKPEQASLGRDSRLRLHFATPVEELVYYSALTYLLYNSDEIVTTVYYNSKNDTCSLTAPNAVVPQNE